MKTIVANKNVVKKIGPKEGKTIQIGNARLTWKAMGVDTAYGTSLYEINLAPRRRYPSPQSSVRRDFLRYLRIRGFPALRRR